MRRMIPSRSALIAFDAAARHQSFTNAASELALTESAISRQINALEKQLGLKLFNRIKKRVILTKAGELYSSQVTRIINQMERDMLNIMAHGGARGIIELAVLPTFCSQWLIPRLGRFYASHPDITINASARSEMFLFKDSPFDAAIHYGQPNWPGTIADELFREEVLAVGSPALLERSSITNAGDILNYNLLHLTSRPDSWHHWFESAGLSSINAMQGSRYEHFSLLISAACSGLGIALIPRFLIIKELQRKELDIAFEIPLESDNAYYLVYPQEYTTNPILAHFREWILREARLEANPR